MNACTFLGHDLGGLVSEPDSNTFGARRCFRCYEAIGGVVIDTAPPTVTQPVEAPAPVRSRIGWLRAVYVNSGEAG